MIISTVNKILRRCGSYPFSGLRSKYETLGVSQSASFKEIREKYLFKSKLLHPDQSAASTDQYHHVQDAYKTLISPEQRKKYDLGLGIRNSVWERELDAGSFSEKFQSQFFEEIMKEESIKVKVSHSSIEEKLQQRFAEQIGGFRRSDLMRSPSFMLGMLGVGVLWLFWETVQTILLHYEGSNKHKVETMQTAKTLKSIPTFTR